MALIQQMFIVVAQIQMDILKQGDINGGFLIQNNSYE